MKKRSNVLRYAVLLMPFAAALAISVSPSKMRASRASDTAAVIEALGPIEGSIVPAVLVPKDVSLYKDINRFQAHAHWKAADEAIEKLHNPLLLGHVLASRYLDPRYTATHTQLTDWSTQYSDYPEASAIYQLSNRISAGKLDVPVIKQVTLEGYGDDNGLVGIHGDEAPYAHTWRAGLQAWRNGHKDIAAKLFSSMDKYSMSPWMQAAADYWAYRSYDATGKKTQATRYLLAASQFPRCFYGILARKQLKQPLNLDVTPALFTRADVLTMASDQGIRRAVALWQIGNSDLAEKELRLRFPQASENDKPRLLALARELGLASVQISMAKQLHNADHELDFARYPFPEWQPEGGFKVDPLLIYALMRQESGFRPSAVSSGGALGLMQLMPQTASFMQKKTGAAPNLSVSMAEPIANITLGQDYIAHLLSYEGVDGNLLYLLAAYNAGPGRLAEWRAHMTDGNDPLLFVESIPYSETRNYVMQVMTNYWIYAELNGTKNHSVYALLKGCFPTYEPYMGMVADVMVKRSLAKNG